MYVPDLDVFHPKDGPMLALVIVLQLSLSEVVGLDVLHPKEGPMVAFVLVLQLNLSD